MFEPLSALVKLAENEGLFCNVVDPLVVATEMNASDTMLPPIEAGRRAIADGTATPLGCAPCAVAITVALALADVKPMVIVVDPTPVSGSGENVADGASA